EDDFNVKKPFLDILSEYYKAEAGSFDIDDPSAPDAINEWIEEKTNGLITEMIQTLPDNTVMLLINAIYFKGQWKMQFDEKATSDMPFFRSGGGTVNVPMMKQKENFRFFQGDGFKIAEFPYGQGNFVMDVILPDEADGLTEVMARLGGSGFSSWINAMTEKELQVSFPRFKYGFRLTLKEILTDMGMGIAFTDAASFSNISEQYDLLINEVTHQSFIETNEEGTEAAAATVVEVGTTSVPVILVFNMDHPFIYIIRETTTNSIIFMGRVSDPSAN
ncbi:MAG: serpin family protein, partial [Bacteroidales bacterium]|nr:serpin family protein [Bacteroidales bacterium]